MLRKLFCVGVWSVIALCAHADPSETLIHLNVQPMPAPKPALRYLLLPELKDMQPGNPIQNYLKCFAEQQTFFFDKETCKRRDELLKMPLKDLPTQEVQDYGRNALRQADWAARLDKPDWQILLQCKTQGISLLLPDLQQMRTLASALKVRMRSEIAQQRFDDALRTAQTLFAMSRHMGDHPTLIGDLVAIAIAHISFDPLEEMLQQPGCPNLYWGLTNLPNPFISVELGMQGERMLIAGEFRDLDKTNAMSEEQLKKLIVHIDRLREIESKAGEKNKKAQSTREWLDEHVKEEAKVSAARRRLVEVGYPEDRLLQFPPEQVILLDEWREFEVRRDEGMKLVNLPTWQGAAIGLDMPYKRSKDTGLFADMLVPALFKVRMAQGRLEQRFALLRHIEAFRIYAAEHGSKLPQTLDEVTVPLPVDPFTGKAFRYNLEGATAHLRGTPPAGMEKNPGFNIHYEITIRK